MFHVAFLVLVSLLLYHIARHEEVLWSFIVLCVVALILNHVPCIGRSCNAQRAEVVFTAFRNPERP